MRLFNIWLKVGNLNNHHPFPLTPDNHILFCFYNSNILTKNIKGWWSFCPSSNWYILINIMPSRTHIFQMGDTFIYSLLEAQFNFNILKTIFIGVKLLYNVLLVSAVHQIESVICIHRSLHFWIAYDHYRAQSRVPCTFFFFFFFH